MSINWKVVPDGFKALGEVVKRNKSTVLVGLGIAGWIGTTVLTAKAAQKAKTAEQKALKDKREDLEDRGLLEEGQEVTLTRKEKFLATWQYYIGPFAGGLVSTVAIGWGHKIDLKDIMSLSGGYQVAKNEIKALKDKIVEKDGEKKLKEYEKDIHEDELRASDPTHAKVSGKGDTLFYEPLTQQWLRSDIWHVERALIHMLEECKSEGTYSLDELLDDLDLNTTPLSGDYAFFDEFMKDIGFKNVHDLFEYHSVDADNGDMRPCIWLSIRDRIANVCDYGIQSSSFRRRPNY